MLNIDGWSEISDSEVVMYMRDWEVAWLSKGVLEIMDLNGIRPAKPEEHAIILRKLRALGYDGTADEVAP